MNQLTGIKDVDREILSKVDEELLKVCSVDKRFWNDVCDDNFLRRRLTSKYPGIEKYKETWKEFFLKWTFYISKMKEDYEYDYTEGDFKNDCFILFANKIMEIPKIGLGTYRLKGKTVYESVLTALRVGYRHIDTASLYGNEKEIGEAIVNSGIKREDIWITTKIKVKDIENGKEKMKDSVLNSLKNLQTEYIDLVLLHGPTDTLKDWQYLEEIYFETGKIKNIGVSNYDVRHLENLLGNCEIRPYVNQFEVNPYLERNYLIDYCQKERILVVAHSSLVKGEKFSDEKLKQTAEKFNISCAQLLLSWALSKNLIIIPRSSNSSHIQENFFSESLSVDLDDFNESYTTHPQYIFQIFSDKK